MRKFFTLLILGLLLQVQVQADDFETAAEAAQNIGVGWNLGNTLEAYSADSLTQGLESENYWGEPTTTKELMTMMKEAGFNAIRIPVTWGKHMDENGNVDAEWMARVHEVVDYVIDNGMYCILNVHHDTGEYGWLLADESVYNDVKDTYESLWKQIATEFKDYDEKLLFEAYNEMLDTLKSWCFASFNADGQYNEDIATSAYNAINDYAQSFVDVVRATGGNNSQRNIIVSTYGACSGSGSWNSHLKDPLKNLKVPEGEKDHLFFEFHYYPTLDNGLSTAEADLDDVLAAAEEYLTSQGVPVIIGEWGTFTNNQFGTNSDYSSNKDNLFDFTEYLITKTKDKNIPTFLWMCLSDGVARSVPYFNQPDFAEKIVASYYGSSEGYEYPSIDDVTLAYEVYYSDASQWEECIVYNGDLSLSEYKGIRVELAEEHAAEDLKLKIYGELKDADANDIKQTAECNGKVCEATFDAAQLGTKVTPRITLQCYTKDYTATITKIVLIKADGTEVTVTDAPSVFWGCTVTAKVITTGIENINATNTVSNNKIYSITGQEVDENYKGLVIKNGRKQIQ